MPSIEEFQAAYKQSLEMRERRALKHDEIQAAYEKEMRTLWKLLFPRRKYAATELLRTDEGRAIREIWEQLARETVVAEEAEKKKLETLLDELAGALPVPTVPDMRLYRTIYSHTYSTQTRPAKYAQEAANIMVADVEARGCQACVRPRELRRVGAYATPHQDFEVWVNVDEVGAEILRRKPGLDLREWVRMCWWRGVNPRVYSPFLPIGLEERWGLDYFGNDLRKQGMSG